MTSLTFLSLLVLFGIVAVVGVATWIYRQIKMAQFPAEATSQLEGMLPGLQADARAFEAAWHEAWANPEWEDAQAQFGGEPCAELKPFYQTPFFEKTEEVLLFGDGAPAEGLPVRNYMPLAMRFNRGIGGTGTGRAPTDYVFAHPGDLEASVYVIDWFQGGPVYHVGREEGERVRIADSLSQFLAWEHRPSPERWTRMKQA